MSAFQQRITLSEAEVIWQRSREAGLLSDRTRSLLVHDLDRMRSRIAILQEVFPSHTLHALAIKANPLVEILREAVNVGAGLEAASIEEAHLALAAECPAERIVFDSPAKTMEEIAEALELGIVLNADNFAELRRIDQLIKQISTRTTLIGLRINPEVGAGTISHTSVGQAGSKFGAPLSTTRSEIIGAFRRYDWLNGVHVHVGSQGCSLDLLARAASRIDELRRELEGTTGRPLAFVDIGGGLPTLYREQQSAPTPQEYVTRLKQEAPELMSSDRLLITEFGRAIQAGCGVALSRVEFVRPEQRMAVIHLGADFLLRPVYRPEDWFHEFFVLDAQGRRKSGTLAPLTITGPLCFSGDIIARDVILPPVDEGDWIVIRDTGAYTLGMWSHHCSRSIPGVVGYDATSPRQVRLLRAAETASDVVRFWSGPRPADVDK
ncbi:MAG: hypothetical protein KDA86_14670 [Planctomycetaceae bacterium]|nr:hypothetical protein [Planctomycetaceae bacterium]